MEFSPHSQALRDAYYAGIIDGDGTVGMHSKGRNCGKRLVIEIKMTNEAIVRGAQAHFGAGHISTMGGLSPLSRKPQWRWRVTGASARRVLGRINSFLIEKKMDMFHVSEEHL